MDRPALPAKWKREELGQLVSFSSGGTPSKENPEYWDGNIPWVTAKDMKTFELSTSELKITNEGLRHGGRTVPEDSILILVRGMTLLKDVPVCLTATEMAFNQDVRGLRPTAKVGAKFLAYALVAQKEQLRALVNIAGHGTGRLATEALAEHPIMFPEQRAEQEAIAGVLSTWDRAMEQTSAVLAAKARLKQGLLQEPLRGKRRSKKSKGTWRTYLIGDVLREVNRHVVLQPDCLYRLVSVRRNSGGLFDREVRLGREIGYSKLMTIETGDFLIARRQVIHGAMTVVDEPFDGAFVSDAYATLVPKDPQKLHMPFLHVLSQTPEMYYSAFRCSYGVAIEKMVFHLDWFLNEQISIPESIEEQKRIAGLFVTLNDEIRQLNSKLDLLKQQKRGLMQQLLTGKIRVSGALIKLGANS